MHNLSRLAILAMLAGSLFIISNSGPELGAQTGDTKGQPDPKTGTPKKIPLDKFTMPAMMAPMLPWVMQAPSWRPHSPPIPQLWESDAVYLWDGWWEARYGMR